MSARVSMPTGLTRRQLLQSGCSSLALAMLGLRPAAGAPAATGLPAAAPPGFDSPEDHLRAWLKIYGELAGDIDVYSWFDGRLSAVTGDRAPLQPLLGFEGFAVNRLVPRDDGSCLVFINEVAFYKDLASGRIIDSWDNPLTGERCEVFQLHAGPLTNRLTTIRRHELPDGTFHEKPFSLPWFFHGNDAFVSIEFNDVRTNPLQPDQWPRESAGEKIRVSESMQFMARLDELQNPDLTHVDSTANWTLLRSWLPWMLMGRRPGHLFYSNFVRNLGARMELIPRQILDETEKRFPEYLTSPPDENFGTFDTSYKIYQRERKPVREPALDNNPD